jgi:hypothetical protein
LPNTPSGYVTPAGQLLVVRIPDMSEIRDLLRETADLAADFLDSLDRRPVFPPASVEKLRARLGGPLPDGPLDPGQVVAELAEAADPGIVATAGDATSAS